MSIEMRQTHEGIVFIFGFFLAAILLTGCGLQGGGSVGNASSGVSGDPTLKSLSLSAGTLAPVFDTNTTGYGSTVSFLNPIITVTATPTDPKALVTVNGALLTSPVSLSEGDNSLNVQVITAGGASEVYTVIVTRQSATTFAQQAYVKASNTDAYDEFGYSVALSGDTLAVGAPFESSNATGINPIGGQNDNSAPNAGAVYVFVRSGITWTQQAYIKASNTDAGDKFGSSVALSGDTLAVGAPFEDSNARGINTPGGEQDNSAQDAGAAYVFVRDSSGAWTQQAYIKGSDTSPNDQLGSSVSLDHDTLVVGAPVTGKVYMFVRSNTTWTQQGYENAGGIGFGWSVAVSGDTLAIGAPFESSNATNAGAVFTYVRSGDKWPPEAYIKASNTDAGDEFGYSVALSGDTLAVGAPFEDSSAIGINIGPQSDNSALNSGAVYVFMRDSSGWSQQAYVKASNTDAGDNFGWSVALDGEVLAVGAPFEDSNAIGINGNQINKNASNAGATYVFIGNGGVWSQQEYVKASNTDPNDWFGYSVALDGGTLAVGAVQESSSATGTNAPGGQTDNSATDAGAVYVYQ